MVVVWTKMGSSKSGERSGQDLNVSLRQRQWIYGQIGCRKWERGVKDDSKVLTRAFGRAELLLTE